MATKLAAAVTFAAALTAAPALAQDTYATLEEAQAMAERAAAYLLEVGPEEAYEAFTFSEEWRDRDLYVFVIDNEGVNRAQGADPDRVGTPEWDLTDANGVLIVQEMLAVDDTGWVDYIWPNPVTGVEEPKRSYIVRVDDVIVGVGAYLAAG